MNISADMWALLAAIGGFLASQFWPFIKERFIHKEQIADKAQLKRDETNERLATALETIVKTLVEITTLLHQDATRFERMESLNRSMSNALLLLDNSLGRVDEKLTTLLALRDPSGHGRRGEDRRPESERGE